MCPSLLKKSTAYLIDTAVVCWFSRSLRFSPSGLGQALIKVSTWIWATVRPLAGMKLFLPKFPASLIPGLLMEWGEGYVLFRGSKSEVKVLAKLNFHLDVLGNNLLQSSIRLLAEFSFLQLWDQGPLFLLAGHHVLVLAAKCCPCSIITTWSPPSPTPAPKMSPFQILFIL